MNLVNYYKSIADEMMTTKDRIRNIINDSHWLTDGEWKESVLRTVLKRHLPDNVGVGRGFVISWNEPSTQIDVLLYDKDYPILFRDGDLVFVTPSAVKGIIEVKSKATNASLDDGLSKLSSNYKLIRENGGNDDIFVGFFAYEKEQSLTDASVFNKLQRCFDIDESIINHVCLGTKRFFRHWKVDPMNTDNETNEWRSYDLEEFCIPYFIVNSLSYRSGDKINNDGHLWFQFDGEQPEHSKELKRVGRREVRVN